MFGRLNILLGVIFTSSDTPDGLDRKHSKLFCLLLCLVFMGYYQLKPLSRALVLDSLGSSSLPFLWAGSAIITLFFIIFYGNLVKKFSINGITAFAISFMALVSLLLWIIVEISPTTISGIITYLMVDICGIAIIELIWSSIDERFDEKNSVNWFGFIGSGALIGGLIGAYFARFQIEFFGVKSSSLFVTSAIIFSLSGLLAFKVKRCIRSNKIDSSTESLSNSKTDGRITKSIKVFSNKLVVLTGMLVLLVHMLEPLVEYQFLAEVEREYVSLDSRTSFVALVQSYIGLGALAVNLLFTQAILGKFGPRLAMLIQPALVLLSATVFQFSGGIVTASILKISDRAFAYSITRTAKEYMFVPLSSTVIAKAKAWIDMFGYRMVKLIGAGVIYIITAVPALAIYTGSLLYATTILLIIMWSVVAIAHIAISKRASKK